MAHADSAGLVRYGYSKLGQIVLYLSLLITRGGVAQLVRAQDS